MRKFVVPLLIAVAAVTGQASPAVAACDSGVDVQCHVKCYPRDCLICITTVCPIPEAVRDVIR